MTTTAEFSVRSLGRTVTGRVPVKHASISEAPAAATAELDLSAIDTGNPRRDRDLRKPNLLDLDRVPTLTFRSGRVTEVANGWRVEGDLIRGEHIAPVELTVTREDDTLVAVGTLDRRLLAVHAPWFLIGRYLTLTVKTERPAASPRRDDGTPA